MHDVTDAAGAGSRIGPVIDSNVHLWQQSANPVFWLSDRTMLRDMLGNYDALPDRFSIDDFRSAGSAFDVTGIVWSDPGTADPLAAIRDVKDQDENGLVVAIVTLADPFSPTFADFVDSVRSDPLVTSVRVRLVPSFGGDASAMTGGDAALVERMRVLADAGMIATIEARPDQLELIADLASSVPELRIVVDHFGWPNDLSDSGRRTHLKRVASLAAAPNVATRIDAIGTIFGNWKVETISPWLQGVVDAFGADRCMLGSDMPIETVRSSFDRLYEAYDTVFRSRSGDERRQLFCTTALRWFGPRPGSP